MKKSEMTPEMKKEKKSKGRKRARRVLCAILAVIVLFVGITTVITVVTVNSNIKKAQSFPTVGCSLKYENVSDGCWNLYSDKEMKILQLTDVHIGGGWMSAKKDTMSINAVAAMISAEKPDFVIVTGDISYPVPFQAGTFNNKSAARIFAALMEKLEVYWTVGYGNHDTEAYSYYSREELTDFYSSGDYPHCLLQAGPEDVDGVGNQQFNVVNSDGIVTRTLFVLDSHSYVDGDFLGIQWKYDNLHENQVQWYANTVKALRENNKKTAASLTADKQAKYDSLCKNVPTSVFQHIPLTEYKDAWNEYVDAGYKDTENIKFNYGTAGESKKVVYCGIHDDDMFETMCELGSTDTYFCGHDHLNNFSLNYKGINLTYGLSVDYLAYPGIYKLGTQRGCTVIKLSPDGSIDWSAENYYQPKYASYLDKEPVTMQELSAGKSSDVQ